MKRRIMLNLAAGSLFTVSGCLSNLSLGSKKEAVRLIRLSIENYSRESYTISVDVIYNGENIHSNRHDVGPRKHGVLGGQGIDMDFPEDPGEFIIRAKMGDNREELNLLDMMDSGCSRCMVVIESNNMLSIFASNEECKQ